MIIKLPKLIATSVVRGSQQGGSHGGIYTVDFESPTGEQHVDWNTSKIDFEGRGADRGLHRYFSSACRAPDQRFWRKFWLAIVRWRGLWNMFD